MPRHVPEPEGPLGSVRTLLVGFPRACPVCQTAVLQGRQSVCSAACRRARSRQKQTARLAARDAAVRDLLVAALRVLDV
jgi:predicted nucleic acid-binding Zn ribbon protein